MSNRRFLAVATLLLAAAASVPLFAEQATAGVEAAMQHYIRTIRQVNSDSAAAMFTAGADLYEGGMQSLHGREAIRTFLKPFDGKAVVDTATSTTLAIEVHGTTAYLWGEYYQHTRIPPGRFAPYHGRFVSEWHREGDGQWRIARMMMQPAS
jgi:ketosteroid isomerase-like protein